VKQKTAKSRAKRAAQGAVRATVPRQAPGSEAKVATPHSTRPRGVSAMARLAAEVERLSAEVAASRLRIGELESRIDVDPLTQTFNRHGFERALARSLAYLKRYRATAALVFLDLDAFTSVNDRHGHAAGNAVLEAVAATLLHEVRASDLIACLGGDEFAILLWNVTEAEAQSKAAALEKAIYATPVRWGASTIVVGASAGVTQLGPLDTPTEALARAAMHAHKMQRNHTGS
jgi:diguanylate cyclase (GGDEF)-like protein